MINSFRDKYSFLSNFFIRPTSINNIIFRSNEHFFVYCKLLNPEDRAESINILKPADVKRFGQQHPMRPDWDNVRVSAMAYGLYHKFFINADLCLQLIDTGTEKLEEGNYWHDNFWGNCSCSKCASIPGKNMLGSLLMNTRDYFKQLTLIKCFG